MSKNRNRARYYNNHQQYDGTPRDHIMPKDSMRTIEYNGITLRIDPSIFDDLEMLEIMHDMQDAEDNPNGAFRMVDLLRNVCGSQYKKVKQALRDEKTGRIPFTNVADFLTTIMEQLAPNS